jgi:DNA-directed RNA polymerase subunit M/transcription elongation factor TFIIS
MFSQKSQAKPEAQFKGIRFCSECDNMLEAKEYKAEEGRYYLQFECKLCNSY